MVRYSETVVAKEGDALRLTDRAGELLLKLVGHEVDEAIRAGYIDPERLHFSLFEFYRIRLETGESQVLRPDGRQDSRRAVERLLGSLELRRLDDGKRPSSS